MFWTARDERQITIKEKWYMQNCGTINPNHHRRLFNDSECRQYVATEYPELLSLYDDLDQQVMKADMFRYLVLHERGGVYFDLDIECLVPIDDWVKKAMHKRKQRKVGAIVGIEFRNSGDRRLQFTQWTMAAQPKHPIYYRTVQIINETVSKIRSGPQPPMNAVHITGPLVFTRAIVEYLIQQGRLEKDQVLVKEDNLVYVNDTILTKDTDEMVGDLLVLHKKAFGDNGLPAGGATYVRHHFAGRWRNQEKK